MNCAIVVPVYRKSLTPLEHVCLLRLRHFYPTDVYLAAPEGLCVEEYLSLWPELKVKIYAAKYFASVKTYNRLMLSTDFYESFSSENEWVLIHQLDAFLFKNNLSSFCSLPYDYFGAPWMPAQLIHPKVVSGIFLKLLGKRVRVGNGGLSLRRLSSTIELLKSKSELAEEWKINEDAFFSYWGIKSDSYFSCPFEIASQFAFESHPDTLYEMTDCSLPFGCHGLPRISQEFYAVHIKRILLGMPELTHWLIQSSIAELTAKKIPIISEKTVLNAE